MTSIPVRPRLAVKVLRTDWREEDHPRDRRGRFIETGAEVRALTGWLARVIRNVGGGMIEVERHSDSERVKIHRNYLMVLSRPDGRDPTGRVEDRPAPLTVQPASPNATEWAPPPTEPQNVEGATGGLFDRVAAVDRDLAGRLRNAARAYQAAMGNDTPDDEADKRAALSALLDEVIARHARDDDDLYEEAMLVHEAIAAFPKRRGDAADGVAAAAPRVDLPEGFIGRYGVLDGEAGTVATRDGRMLTGLLHAAGPGRMIAVERDDNTWVEIPATAVLGIRLRNAYPGVQSNRREGSRNGTPGTDRRGPLEDAPSGGLPGAERPGGVLRQPGDDSAGADRRADGPGGGGVGPDVRRPDATDDRGPGASGVDGDPGGAADDAGADPGAGAGRGGVRSSGPRLPGGQGQPGLVATRREVYRRSPSADRDDTTDPVDADTLRALEGMPVAITLYNDDGVAADHQVGRITGVEEGRNGYVEFDWQPGLDGDTPPYPISADDVHLLTRIPEPDDPNQPTLFGDALGAATAETLTSPGRPDATGTPDDPIDVDGDLDRAVRLIGEGKHIRLNRVDEVGTLLDRLVEETRKAGAEGTKFDLCLVSVSGTNLFCQDTLGIPRLEMPQLGGDPRPGSPAASLPRNAKGRVDIKPAFRDALVDRGVSVTRDTVSAASLKASQGQLDGPTVAGMLAAMRQGGMANRPPIFVTRDGYVIDGHHQWAARVALDTEDGTLGDVTIDVEVLDLEIGAALEAAREFAARMGVAGQDIGQRYDAGDRGPTVVDRAEVGSWVAKVDVDNRDVLRVRGSHGVKGRISQTLTGWHGWLDSEPDGIVSGESVQAVLDGLYERVNGDGSAEIARREVTEGRPAAPEVGATWADTEPGARVRVTPTRMVYDVDTRGYVVAGDGDPVDAEFVSYEPPGRYGALAGRAAVVVIADDGTRIRTYVEPGQRPVPARPALVDEEEAPDLDDDPQFSPPNPSLVPDRVAGGTAFRPTGMDDLAPAGKMAKLDANLAALRVLRDLRAERRAATSEEQAVLARWAGWGGLPEVFDPSRAEYASRRAELQTLLTEAEMVEARRNTLNAHYTDARVVQSVWDAVEGLGFTGGRVLEPGSGSGTFVGFAPDGANMTGVELDSTTAAISKYLYPDAQIRNESFADTRLPDGVFDATVGNVPFGRFSLTDPVHNRDGHSIHNHFILKSLALTKPGGIVAVLSSRYTLDSQNDTARRAMYEQADLVGAVRLPNGSHQRASETDVIEDILIFRKRKDGETPGDDTWLTSSKRDLNGWNVTVNHYFDANPDHALGEITAAKGQFGGEVRVVGDKTLPGLPDRLQRIVADARDRGLAHDPDVDPTEPQVTLIEPGEGRYEGHLRAEADGTFTQASNGVSVPVDVPATQREELTALLGLRDTLIRLLDAEAGSGEDTEEITELRGDLNRRYDAYVATYGPINRFKRTKSGARNRPPMGGFRSDPKAAVVAALETYTPPPLGAPASDQGSATKASVFTTRAVAPRSRVTSVESPADALALVMDEHGEVNLPAVARLLETDEATARERLGALVFDVPPLRDDEAAAAVLAARARVTDPTADVAPVAETFADRDVRLVPAAEYLSGNVRVKLAEAEAAAAIDPRYQANVDALRGVIPHDLGPQEIDARLGAAWVDADTVRDFLDDLLGTPSWKRGKGRGAAQVASSGGGIWTVNAPADTVRATQVWGTDARPLHKLVQSLLEQRPITVTYKDPVTKRQVQDLEATLEAQAKAEEIQERFAEWVWEDPDRARRLAARYNDQFNGLALRAYDGQHRAFPGMSEEWQAKVQPHVKNAVERIVNEPTAMLAHVVGAGKTAEMVMGSAELKRLGLARKPAIVVPNHMLEQFQREYLEIYPAARILTAGQAMSAEERRRFVARAATGDWDAVVMTQGAFESIPMSQAQQQAYIDREMATLRAQLAEARAAAEGSQVMKRTVKKMETAVIRAEEGLKKRLLATKDVGVSFEQTGIDYLMVDEAHEYANLRVLSNIPNAGASGSNMATDLHMKMEYLRANTRSGRVATFATGTPIRNTITQAYVMVKYLRPDLLEQAGLHSFDQWAATFGEVVAEMELKPEGSGFRQTARFAKFRNVPEFLRMFHTFADVKMAEDLNLPRPNLAGGQAKSVSVPRTDALAEFIADLGERADAVRKGTVEPTEDNMLKISTDGRKAALSMRLVGGEHEPGKLEAAADRIAAIYEANRDKTYGTDPTPGALQIAFLDMGTPKGKRGRGEAASVDDNDVDWSAYDHLRDELVARGVPRDKIRYIHEAKNDAEKAELFAAARDGRIAVLVGSSERMGVGTNMQRRAKALHHIDAPWRPADVEQRDGRIHRQGNLHMNMGEDVEIYRYVTEGSFDAYMWQTLERKAKFINQVMRGTLDVREIEDVGDTAMSYAEVKAIATGNPDLLDKAKADTAVAKLQRLARAHARAQQNLTQDLSWRETSQTGHTEAADALGGILSRLDPDRGVTARDADGSLITAEDDADADDRAAVAKALADRADAALTGGYSSNPEQIGDVGGLPITVEKGWSAEGSYLTLQVAGYGFARLVRPISGRGIVHRLERFIRDAPIQEATQRRLAAEAAEQVTQIRDRMGVEFPRAAELAAWTRRAERIAEKMRRDEQRADGMSIPFDPAIDTDQDDDPLTRASAERYVPEEVPARAEVTAGTVNVGARIEFVQAEMSGTVAEGTVRRVKHVGGFVFLTIATDDGKEYVRAFDVDQAVVKVGVSGGSGVKGFRPARRLSVVNGRVVVTESKGFLSRAFGAARSALDWDESLHPRGRDGRFIEKGGTVRLTTGGTGVVESFAGGGRVNVRLGDGTVRAIDAGLLSSTPAGPAVVERAAAGAPRATRGPSSRREAVFKRTARDGRVEEAWLRRDSQGNLQGVVRDADGEETVFADPDEWARHLDGGEGWESDSAAGDEAASRPVVRALPAPDNGVADRARDRLRDLLSGATGDPDTGDVDMVPRLRGDLADLDAAIDARDPDAFAAAVRALTETLEDMDRITDGPDGGAGGDTPGGERKATTVAPDAPLPDDLVAEMAGSSAADHLVQGEDGSWRFTPERVELHQKIIADLLDAYEPQEQPKYHVMGGGPAAGKSTIEKKLPEISEGHALLNADEIKEMLPEYGAMLEAGDSGAAGFVHEESSYLVKMVQAEAFARRLNVTLDGTGDSSAAAMRKKIKSAREAGYTVNGYYVTADTDEAVARAQARAAKTGRMVAETVIRHTHKAVSSIFEDLVGDFDRLVLMDTQHDGVNGDGIIATKDPGGTLQVVDQDLYDRFLDKANE